MEVDAFKKWALWEVEKLPAGQAYSPALRCSGHRRSRLKAKGTMERVERNEPEGNVFWAVGQAQFELAEVQRSIVSLKAAFKQTPMQSLSK